MPQCHLVEEDRSERGIFILDLGPDDARTLAAQFDIVFTERGRPS
jgi:hypothetical protein